MEDVEGDRQLGRADGERSSSGGLESYMIHKEIKSGETLICTGGLIYYYKVYESYY